MRHERAALGRRVGCQVRRRELHQSENEAQAGKQTSSCRMIWRVRSMPSCAAVYASKYAAVSKDMRTTKRASSAPVSAVIKRNIRTSVRVEQEAHIRARAAQALQRRNRAV